MFVTKYYLRKGSESAMAKSGSFVPLDKIELVDDFKLFDAAEVIEEFNRIKRQYYGTDLASELSIALIEVFKEYKQC